MRRRAMWPLLVYPLILLMNLLRHRYAIDTMVAEHHILLEQLMLVIAFCVVVATIGFGVKAWRDAMVDR